MNTKRLLIVLTLAMTMVLASACSPRAITPPAPAANSDALVVQLPAIILDVAADGQISVAEGPLTQVLSALDVDLSNLSMSEETVGKLTAAGVKHLQIETLPDGMYLFMNGEQLPTFVWDKQSLTTLGPLLDSIGVDLGDTGKLLPLLPDLGLGVVLRLPGGSGAQAPRLAQGVTVPSGQPSLANAFSQQVTTNITINYAADGSGQLQGGGFIAMMIPPDALRQSPDAIAGITERGIEGLGLILSPSGLAIQINGEPAIYFRSSSEAQLMKLIQLLLGVAGGDQAAQMGPLINQILPPLLRGGLSLTVNFPAA
jgi:hypothetical protein